MDSIFYYNRANGDGGAACIRNADLNISKCTFVQNHAVGNGGAFLLDNSAVDISLKITMQDEMEVLWPLMHIQAAI